MKKYILKGVPESYLRKHFFSKYSYDLGPVLAEKAEQGKLYHCSLTGRQWGYRE